MRRAHRYPPSLDELVLQFARIIAKLKAPLHGLGGTMPAHSHPAAAAAPQPPPSSELQQHLELQQQLQQLSLDDFCRRINFVPDRKQQLVLASISNRIILNGSRQTGKSHILAVRAVRKLLSATPARPKLVLIVAKTKGQAEETIFKMDRCFSALNIRTHGDPTQTIARVLPDDSRVIGLAADDTAVRSYTADLVILDEAALVPDDVWDAIEPTLATTDGDLIVASTPRGKRGLFWETWTNGGPEWLKVQNTVHECPRISKNFIESQRRRGEAFFKQEYECQFVESGLYLLGRDQVERLINDKELALT
jgi:hypothetical protein